MQGSFCITLIVHYLSVMESCVILVLGALTIIIHDVSSWSFSPSSLPIPLSYPYADDTLSATFMCQANTPLVKCHVNMYESDYFNEFVDLSQGRNSGVISRYHEALGDEPYNVSYVGTGLENGQCGAVYSIEVPVSMIFTCRGANAAGEWQEMEFILATFFNAIPATITPLNAIAKPGGEVTFHFHSKPMSSCQVQSLSERGPMEFSEDKDNENSNDSYRYFGTGLSLGECGVTLLNLTEEDNGPITILGTHAEKHFSHLISSLIIAAPPAEVSFKVDKMSYSVGDTLNATCSSLLSRPVANLTWTLDDRIIRQDAKKDLNGDVWTWSWDKQNITQNLSLKLEEEDFGKMLECRVQHLDIVYSNSSYVITRS